MKLYPSFNRKNYPHNLDINKLFEKSYKRNNEARLILISEFTPLEILQAACENHLEFGNWDRINDGFNFALESEEYHNEDYK